MNVPRGKGQPQGRSSVPLTMKHASLRGRWARPGGLVLPADFTASDDGDSSGHLELCKPYGFALCEAHVNSIYVKKICRSADRQHCRKGLDLRPGEGVRPETGSYHTRDVARGLDASFPTLISCYDDGDADRDRRRAAHGVGGPRHKMLVHIG